MDMASKLFTFTFTIGLGTLSIQPHRRLCKWTACATRCRPCCVAAMPARSSTYAWPTNVRRVAAGPTHNKSGCDRACMSRSTGSTKIAYSSGDRGHPCATPRRTANSSAWVLLVLHGESARGQASPRTWVLLVRLPVICKRSHACLAHTAEPKPHQVNAHMPHACRDAPACTPSSGGLPHSTCTHKPSHPAEGVNEI